MSKLKKLVGKSPFIQLPFTAIKPEVELEKFSLPEMLNGNDVVCV